MFKYHYSVLKQIIICILMQDSRIKMESAESIEIYSKRQPTD